MKKITIIGTVAIVSVLILLAFFINHRNSIAGDDFVGGIDHCVLDEDCIPLPSDCHPTTCVNKGLEAHFEKPEMCTEIFMMQAAYLPEDCMCVNNKCFNKNLKQQSNELEERARIDLGQISEYVDRDVTIEGCLKFACPTAVGASFPEDCIAYVEDNTGRINALLFDESLNNLKEYVYGLYEFDMCIKTKVNGTVNGNICDSPCVSTYDVDVTDLVVLPSGCVDSDGGINYYERGEISGVCTPGTACGIFIDVCSDEDTVYEYSCGASGEDYSVEYYTCPNGCSDGACNPT